MHQTFASSQIPRSCRLRSRKAANAERTVGIPRVGGSRFAPVANVGGPGGFIITLFTVFQYPIAVQCGIFFFITDESYIMMHIVIRIGAHSWLVPWADEFKCVEEHNFTGKMLCA